MGNNVVGPLFSELHDWFRRNGIQRARMVADKDYAPSLLETYGYTRMYGFDMFEKPLLHGTETSILDVPRRIKEKSVKIDMVQGDATIQFLPSGKRSLISPPNNYDHANNVMRKLEVWLGSKDVETARYVADLNSRLFPGYLPTNKILYSNKF